MKMVEFSSVGHVAIKTSDIERSLDFYVRQLRFSEMLRLHYSDDSLFLIYLRVTDTQYLELFPHGIGDRAPDRDAVALNHFCLIVDNIDHTLRQIAQAGIALTRELKTGADGNRQAWIEDPDGNRIEIMELASNCMQFEALKGLRAGTKPIVKVTDVPSPKSLAPSG
jgi:lactoylglutathione lyase